MIPVLLPGPAAAAAHMRVAALGLAVVALARRVAASAAAGAPPPALYLCMSEALSAHRGVLVALDSLGAPATVSCAVAPDAPPDALRVHVALDTAMRPQEYELRQAAEPPHALELGGGDTNGVIYGLLDLPRLLRSVSVSDDSTGAFRQRGGPAFTSRVYSIEGQYLDLPDASYYGAAPTYLNTSLVQSEASAIARGLPALVRNRITALVLLHPNVEDYITYKYLGRGDEVWPPATSRVHLQRAAALCTLLAKLVNDTHAHGLKFYFKPYELGFPKQLPKLYQLGLETLASINSTRVVLVAKYRELFECTGADGIVLTAEETHPRGGYGSMALAKSPATVAALATVFHDAIVTACGKDLQMRLWRLTGKLRTVGGQPDGPNGTFSDFVQRFNPPTGMLYSTKEGAGDFFLRVPDNPLLASATAPKLRNFSVEIDVFRQYESWGRMLIWMSSWGERLLRYNRNGVSGVGLWGDWQGSSVWPDCQPGYLVLPEGRDCTTDPVSWRIPQDRYYSSIDAFPDASGSNGTTATVVPWRAGAATLFLGSQLAFDPRQDVTLLAHEYTSSVFGAGDAAAAAAEALLATEVAFTNRYLLPTKHSSYGAYQGWTLIFQFGATQRSQVDEAMATHGLPNCLAIDSACMAGSAKVLAASQRVTGDTQPAVEFRRSGRLTELFLRTNSLFRSVYMVNANLTSSAPPDRRNLCLEHFAQPRTALDAALEEWASFPIEGADFNIVAPSPQLVGHHTEYMSPVPMVAYLNGSIAGVHWLYDSSCAPSPAPTPAPNPPSPGPSPGGPWHCVSFTNHDLLPCAKLKPGSAPYLACQAQICTGHYHANFTHGVDGNHDFPGCTEKSGHACWCCAKQHTAGPNRLYAL